MEYKQKQASETVTRPSPVASNRARSLSSDQQFTHLNPPSNFYGVGAQQPFTEFAPALEPGPQHLYPTDHDQSNSDMKQGNHLSSTPVDNTGLGCDPRAMLNNLSFLEQKIHQVQDIVRSIMNREGHLSLRPNELAAQQQLVTADLTSIIIQLISTAGTLLPSINGTLLSTNSPVAQLGNIIGSPTGLVGLNGNLEQSEGFISEGTKGSEFEEQVQGMANYVSDVPDATPVEDQDGKDFEDGVEGENLPPGSYEVLQLEKEEILAPHTHFCSICGKGFKRDANLRMHMRGHGDEYKTPAALAKPSKDQNSEPVLIKRYSCPFVGCKRNKEHRKFQPLNEFEQLSLAPGEATSIGFVFLPRWLGTSSAHLVLQTNFGGFVIHAKGTAVDSPYRIQPLVGFDVASDGRLSKKLSMYNSLDEVIYVEEVRALISISYENRSHTAHIVCQREPSDQPSGDFNMMLNGNKWFNLEHGEFGESFVGLSPHRLWELHPHNTESIIEINLFTHREGNFSGVLCMKYHGSSFGKNETIVVPLEAHVKDRVGYHTPSGSISVFLESASPCESQGSVFSLFVRNSASYLLRLVKVIEMTNTIKLFEVKYIQGLILYPGTVTHVALVIYSSDTNLMETSAGMPAVMSNCKLAIVTNDSVSPLIEVPCEDLVKTCLRHEARVGLVASEDSYVDMWLQHEEKQSTDAKTGSLGNTGEELFPIKLSPLGGSKVDKLIVENWRSHGTMVGMSVLEDHEVFFPMVQVGTYQYRWISVKNPSQKPVLMQLVLNSAVIVDQCKSVDFWSDHHFFTRPTQMQSNRNMHGFSIAETALVEAFVHPLGAAEFGPIIFQPLSRCMWRTSVLIRNNLSGVEWLPLQGVGGFQSLLLLEDSEPVQKLLFDLNLLPNLNVSSREHSFHAESSGATCAHLLSKELYAKNAGEFPLEVINLDISGNSCRFNGFVIQNCRGFTLEPGESTRLLISFQPDFSAAVVHRDLELVMSTGILVIPMKASLPINMLKLCRKPILSTLLMKFLLVVLLAALVSILLCALSRVSSIISEDLLMNKNKNIATVSRVGKTSRLHRNPKNTRSLKEDHKPEVSVISKEDFDHQNKGPFPPPPSSVRHMEEIDSSQSMETHQSDNLTIRVIKEKSRRRKRRAGGGGAGLAAMLEVSSSQSGNSTPSSPLSPGDYTRQLWPGSPQASEHPFARGAELNNEKGEMLLAPGEVHESGVSMNCGSSSVPCTTCEQSLSEKTCGRPVLLPSATFPGACRRTSCVIAPVSSISTSPIAPHARAPGSKLSMEKMVKMDEESASGEEFIYYNIWGNHFGDHLLKGTSESPPRASDASEGDSRSFFAEDPQTLMMMSSAISVSPTPERSYGVNYPRQKG